MNYKRVYYYKKNHFIVFFITFLSFFFSKIGYYVIGVNFI